MARYLRNGLGLILFFAITAVGVMNVSPVEMPDCYGDCPGPISFTPFNIPLIAFVQRLPLLSIPLLVMNLVAVVIGIRLERRASNDIAAGISFVLVMAPFITLLIVGILALIIFPAANVYYS